MYALVNDNKVLAGPMDWNRAIFDGNLEKLQINVTLPSEPPAELPLIINENTAIYNVELTYPEHNSKIHYLEGPYWDFSTNVAVASHIAQDQPIESVKLTLKAQAADERWKKEVADIHLPLQSILVTIDASRSNRDVFSQSYLLMGVNDVLNWKFPESWLSLTKQEMGAIVMSGVVQIQNAFVWEQTKGVEIDACTTLAECDAVVIIGG